MDKLYHLQKDIGVNKSNLKTSFYRWYGDRLTDYDEHALKVRDLLERRGQMYTLSEIDAMLCYYASAHHECVVDNRDDYLTKHGAPSIEIYLAEKHLEREVELRNLIKQLQEQQSKGE